MKSFVFFLGDFFTRVFLSIQDYIKFMLSSLSRIFYPAVKFRLVLQQMEFIGVKSALIIVMASIMVGAVFGIQFGTIFRTFGVESLIGAAASFSLSRELSPVFGAFLVAGRAGSAITAEIASMKVNEQIDALRIMSVNPISYLSAPRVAASIIMLPLLSGLFTICGVLSSYVIGVLLFEVDVAVFVEKIRWLTRPEDIFAGLQKSVVFGVIYSTIACYKGLRASGGAKGVGKSTTESVVMSLVTIIIVDFFMTYYQMRALF